MNIIGKHEIILTSSMAWYRFLIMRLPETVFPELGYCVYCGNTKEVFTREHIIPYALNGSFILPKASCRSCSMITSKFENKFTRINYGQYRLNKNYSSRNKKKRPTEQTCHITEEGNKDEIKVKIDDLPNVFPAWILPTPGILRGIEPSVIIPESEMQLMIDKENNVEQFMQLHKCNKLNVTFNFQVSPFLKLLAKIGHCYAHALTLGKAYQALLPNIIIGSSEYGSHYIGGIEDDYIPKNEYAPLTLSIRYGVKMAFLVVRIQLLNPGSLPPYQVVAGYIPNLENFCKMHGLDYEDFLANMRAFPLP